jgi:CHAT domain-containing protein
LAAGQEEICESREPPLIVGGPDFDWPATGALSDETPGDSFPESVGPLPGAAAEAVAIAALFSVPPSRTLIGDSASEAVVKAVRGPWLLHLATHGFFLPVPLGEEQSSSFGGDRLLERARETQLEVFVRSGVALAGYNRRRQARDADDGLLTALEVMDLDLCGTELVTLSACETGLGEARSGQGVFGLRRALALAGARSQLLALWKVPDEATKDLMVSFYSRLRPGVSLAEALRQAQLAALGRAPIVEAERGARPPDRPAGAHPHVWASFVLSGRTVLAPMAP